MFCKRLVPDAKIPTRAHISDAGYDVFCLEEVVIIPPGQRKSIRTGIAISCPTGVAWQVWPRSGLAQRCGIGVLGGLIDSGYRGEVIIMLQNLGEVSCVFNKGDKIAQIVPIVLYSIELTESNDLPEADRGNHGFGSTGM